MITVSHLTKRYGAQLAVDDLSFRVDKGEVVGFLGPNGAGKSTTLRILAGFLGPTSGEVTIAGHDVARDSFEARRCIGYMPEAVPLYPEMRVIEYLRFRAELKRVPRAKRAAFAEEAMVAAGVVDVAHKRIGALSKGYRQRVGLADAVLAKPPILILDEPTAGLDPNQIRQTRDLVRDLGREHAVVLSTHILSEVEACATRVVLIHRGKLVAEGPTATIRAMSAPGGGARAIAIEARAAPDVAERVLSAVEGVEGVAIEADLPGSDTGASDRSEKDRLTRCRVSFASDATGDGHAIERCVAALVAAGAGVREVRPAGGSLEDVFASLTRDDAIGGAGGAASTGTSRPPSRPA